MQGSACALAMLSECGEYDVGKGEKAVALRLHCGMGRQAKDTVGSTRGKLT